MNVTTTSEVRQRFLVDLDTLQAKFKALVEAIPADKYAWRPAPGVRSVGEAFMRAAIAGADVNALSGTRRLFSGDRTIIETSFIMSGDLHEHLGQLIAYARAQGIKPPWSK